MDSHNGSVTIYIRNDIELEIEYNYSYDAGVHTYSNGDPGYPPSEDFEIIGIYKDGVDYTPVLDRFAYMFPKADIIQEIEDLAYENMEEYEPDYEPDYDDYIDRY
jgi:hypothetical protein